MFPWMQLKTHFHKPLPRLLLLAGVIFILGLLLKPPPTVEVVVVAQTLQPGESVQAELLQLLRVDRRLVPGGAILAEDASLQVGKRAIRPLARGEMLTWSSLEGSRLRPSRDIPEGMRLVVVQPQNLADLDGYIHVDDRVDLIWMPRENNPQRRSYPLLQNVAVHDISLNQEAAANLSLILPVAEAVRLTHAQQMGVFRLLLRNPDDQSTDSSAMIVDNQKLLRNYEKNPDDEVEIIYGNNHLNDTSESY